VANNHQIILSSNREFDKLIADKIVETGDANKANVKDHLLFLLPDRIKSLCSIGRVKTFETTRWWIEERTYLVQALAGFGNSVESSQMPIVTK
jgi:hypothetical protein